MEGLDRLPRGPHLLACNHLGWVDPFILIAWLPASPRLHFLGRRSAMPAYREQPGPRPWPWLTTLLR